ncbi:MAG TPA: aldo/keto reductase [Candidatus Sulfotelmatobacter sp.]|jgi:aryl-alcohol dehydrogenase-like predicted oxidoreductase|nr:aldo/keto reductase [Candidatus Sulfotelmatobacter sp.]
MKTRTIGPLTVSALGLGCMGMSEFYGAHDDGESLRTLERAGELGVTLLDTADMYGIGHNEELLSRFLKGRRDRFVLATKFGIVRDSANYAARSIDNSPAYIRKACEASLRRLGVEVIDLYYAHRRDKTRPIEETVGTMAELVKEGKVRALGLSEVSAGTLARAQAVHPIAALQSEWSLWSRDPETNGVLDACRKGGTAFVAYSPLGRGFLTGRLDGTEGLAENDFRRLSPRFREENLARNLALVDKVKAQAGAKGCTPGQLVLAWLLAQGSDVVPIPGTRRIPHLEENLKALDVTLSQGEIKALSDAVPPGAAAGDRYPTATMGNLNA